jgi:hypothetical protein
VSNTISIPTRELFTVDVTFLMRRENFDEKILAALGFLLGVIAFLSGLIVTMTWMHFLEPLGLNVNVSSFLLMLSFLIPPVMSIVAPMVLKKDVCHQIPLNLGRPFLNTTKSIGTKEFQFSLKCLHRFPLEAGSIDPPATDARK